MAQDVVLPRPQLEVRRLNAVGSTAAPRLSAPALWSAVRERIRAPPQLRASPTVVQARESPRHPRLSPPALPRGPPEGGLLDGRVGHTERLPGPNQQESRPRPVPGRFRPAPLATWAPSYARPCHESRRTASEAVARRAMAQGRPEGRWSVPGRLAALHLPVGPTYMLASRAETAACDNLFSAWLRSRQ